MSKVRTLILAAIGVVALAATAEAGTLTNGPNGTEPNTMASRQRTTGINAKMPSRAMTHRPRRH